MSEGEPVIPVLTKSEGVADRPAETGADQKQAEADKKLQEAAELAEKNLEEWMDNQGGMI